MQGLTHVARSKPATQPEALASLARYLLDNNPNMPRAFVPGNLPADVTASGCDAEVALQQAARQKLQVLLVAKCGALSQS